ncbi:MAG: HigA family addiction module antidote protein, partial [Pseudobutyrivibrio sp.]|nr:HigA family addiction module antidote protein [Pseudobutyrivibrio sp.]
MSNYIEFDDKVAFHPGYYIKELIDESGLTQEDFAKRLDTTPKNLSLLIRGEQSLSTDIALKLSKMLGTSINYWLNLQNNYDALLAQYESKDEIEAERRVFSILDYKYFRNVCGLPNVPRKIDEQIKYTREKLGVSSLTVLTKRDMAVSFRSASAELSESNIVKANSMVQIAIKKAAEIEAPKYDKKAFEKAVEYSLTLTEQHKNFYPLVKKAFLEAGVLFVVMPNMPGSKINGATKKIGNNIMLMVSDRNVYADTFWFTLFHEVGHILNGDYGISFEKESGDKEDAADNFAANVLVPQSEYVAFKEGNTFTISSVKAFAKKINRDPGIVLGRL